MLNHVVNPDVRLSDVCPVDILLVDIWLVTFWGVGQLAGDIFMCYFNMVLNEITIVTIAREV